jgi:queuine tRNA-ribosyltransferase
MGHFEVLVTEKDCFARRAAITTPHGMVDTPAFMPIGSAGAVKGITPEQLKKSGAQMLLANAYHLLLRPGPECIESIGGIHKLTAWDGPILTDSGGYQIFSLSKLTQISDEGVEFTSYVDGQKIFLTPEGATKIQNRLGADIIMCLDECTPFPCEFGDVKRAVERTINWAQRCKKAHDNNKQMLFGIVQGGIEAELRERCATELVKTDFDGYAIGGLSVGEGHEDMVKTVRLTIKFFPKDRPRYLMGVGTPIDIIAAVREGIDMFDCVLPTRNGRNAFAFTENGFLRMRNSRHINDKGPIEKGCDCYCCRAFSRAAIRHFFNIGEMLGPILVSIHNLRFYQRLMENIRKAIENKDFDEWSTIQLKKLSRLRETPDQNTENDG